MPEARRILEESIEQFCRDNVSGSSSLVQKAADIILIICREYPDGEIGNGIRHFIEKSSKCHEGMAALARFFDGMVRIIDSTGDSAELRKIIKAHIERGVESFEESTGKIAHNLCPLLEAKSTIITLSRSGTVLNVLQELFQSGKVCRVILPESRPAGEGILMARELGDLGIAVTLIVDSAVDSLSSEADAAVIGADSIYENGDIINKIGSRSLALSCRERDIPFYVVSQRSKMAGKEVNEPVESELRPSNEITTEVLPGKVEIKNFYFETVEFSLITGIIFEDGVFKP